MTDEELAQLDAEAKAKAAAAKAATDKAAEPPGYKLPGTEGMSDEDLAAMRPGMLGNSSADDPLGGAKNIATTVLKGVAGMKGIGQGVMDTGRAIGAGVQSIWSGPTTTKEILERNEKERMEAHERKMAAWQRAYDAMPDGANKWGLKYFIDKEKAHPLGETAESIYKETFKPLVGEYEPKSWVGKKIRAGGEMAMPMLLSPGAGFGALATGFGTGVATDVVNDVSPNNPNPGLITSFALPFGVQGARYAKDRYMPKTSPDQTFREASRELARTAAAKDKQALYEKAKMADETGGLIEGQVAEGEHGPGAPNRVLPQGTKTIAELTGDEGLAALERAARAEGKPLPEGSEAGAARTIDDVKTDRAQGRVEAGKGTLDPDSSPLAVAQFVEERQRALDEGVSKLGDPMAAGEAGGLLKQKATEYWKWFKQQTSRLYNAIDPHDQFQLLTPGVQEAVKTIAAEERPGFGGAPSPGVKTYLDRATTWPKVVGFNDLQAYLKEINLKVRETAPTATSQGDPGAHRHYKILRDAAMGDVKNAVANQAAHEAELVKQGKMKEGDTLAARLAKLDVEEAGPTSAVPGEPNLTPQAAGDLQAALANRVQQANIFDNSLVRGIIGAGESDAGKLAAKAFPGKTGGGIDTGAEVTRKVLQATNNAPEAISALQDHAVALLQSMGETMQTAEGGTVTRITPKSVQKFLEKYGGSLAALEEAQPGFMAKFQNVANVQSELARKFIDERSGAKGAEASRAIVGDIMGDPRNGPSKLQAFMKDAPPDVVEGMKHLLIENMFGGSIDQVAGNPHTFNGPKFLKLMNSNRAVLEAAGFTAEHMKVWEALAKDFSSQAAHENVAIPGKLRQNSITAGNLEAIDRAFAAEKAPFQPKNLRDFTIIGGLQGIWPGLAIKAADIGWQKLQQMAHNAKLAGITSRNDLIRAGIIDPELGLKMLRIGAEKYTDPSYPMRVGQALADSAYYAMPGVVAGAKETEKARGKRAAGGRTTFKLDHKSRAAALVRKAEQIRKGHGKETKAFLHTPDDAVADALATASRGL
jgi:hypothetical protein